MNSECRPCLNGGEYVNCCQRFIVLYLLSTVYIISSTDEIKLSVRTEHIYLSLSYIRINCEVATAKKKKKKKKKTSLISE